MIDPQKDPSVVPRLTRTITDYLKWMKSVRYSPASCHQHRIQLELFLSFVKNSDLLWQQLFAGVTRERFKKLSQLTTTAAVNGLSRYLAQQGQIKNRLGHENIQSTMVYLHMDLASKQAVQKKFVQYATSALKLDPKLDALIDWDHKQDILSWLDSL